MSNPSESGGETPRTAPNYERELLLDFALSEVHLGLAFVAAARAAYGHGRIQFGDDARAKAQNVMAEAKALAERLGVESKPSIGPHLQHLQESLDGLVRPAT